MIPGDPAWPTGLDDLGALAPFALWVRGAPPAAPRAVALVGARASTTYGERVTVDLAVELARRGWAVVSGGAYGIDAAAHRGAHGEGRTLVVLAGGVDRAYPVGNAPLLEEVVRAGGSLVSEVPPGATPSRSRFLQRNRLIAAISGATVVVEAAWRSGAVSTAHHAGRLLRPVGAVPAPSPRRRRRAATACCATGSPCASRTRRRSSSSSGTWDPIWRPRRTGMRHAPRTASTRWPGRCTTGCRAGPRATPRRSPRAPDDALAQARAMLGLLELEGLARRAASGWVVGDAHE
ncbi:DNA-processing protein DprA [Cellulomonas phragmiteti]|uniref:DNA-processing protein DprA n=1 Tax=Cellulomonas phragmiteti TaxID=478780 RepID=UPI0036291C09